MSGTLITRSLSIIFQYVVLKIFSSLALLCLFRSLQSSGKWLYVPWERRSFPFGPIALVPVDQLHRGVKWTMGLQIHETPVLSSAAISCRQCSLNMWGWSELGAYGPLLCCFALPAMVTSGPPQHPSAPPSNPGISCRGHPSHRENVFL